MQPPSGAALVLPFEVLIDVSVPLGSPADGLHHAHIWFGDDFAAYLVVESTTVEVATAPIGEHEMHVSLRNPDHSATGVEASVPIVVRATTRDAPSTLGWVSGSTTSGSLGLRR